MSVYRLTKNFLKPPPGTSDISNPFLFVKKQHLQSKITCATLGICLAECRHCEAGTHMDRVGFRGPCEKCPRGTFSSTGGTRCTYCPRGEISDAGSASCAQCPAGYYATSSRSACEACSAGSFSAAGTSNCTVCLAGTFSHSMDSQLPKAFTLGISNLGRPHVAPAVTAGSAMTNSSEGFCDTTRQSTTLPRTELLTSDTEQREQGFIRSSSCFIVF